MKRKQKVTSSKLSANKSNQTADEIVNKQLLKVNKHSLEHNSTLGHNSK